MKPGCCRAQLQTGVFIGYVKMEQIHEQLKNILNPNQILTRVPMKEHTSFRVGGEAAMLVLPSSIQEVAGVKKVLNVAHVPHVIIGNGTNLIVSDKGYSGVILKLAVNFSKILVNDHIIIAQAGASLAAVSHAAWENALTGLEFASGIPGTTGGAVAMNAGAYGGEMKDVVVETMSLNDAGDIVTLCGNEHAFGYRKSRFQEKDLIVLEIKMSLAKGEPDSIREKMQALNARRREKQPLNLPSAGSVFKRPEGYYAGKLIQDAGLQGWRIGGAQVSDKHCGFIVNTGNATASDIIALIQYVKDRVFQNSGVMLEEEVKILGG